MIAATRFCEIWSIVIEGLGGLDCYATEIPWLLGSGIFAGCECAVKCLFCV